LFASTLSPPLPSNNLKQTVEKSTSVETEIPAKILTEKEISPSRAVDKILIFYTDKTFDEFLPAK